MIIFKNQYGWQESVTKKDQNGQISIRKFMNVRFVKCQEPVGTTKNGSTMARIEPIRAFHGVYARKDGSTEFEYVIMEYEEEGQPQEQPKVASKPKQNKLPDVSNLMADEEELPFF